MEVLVDEYQPWNGYLHRVCMNRNSEYRNRKTWKSGYDPFVYRKCPMNPSSPLFGICSDLRLPSQRVKLPKQHDDFFARIS
jgi:hypothetical protein